MARKARRPSVGRAEKKVPRARQGRQQLSLLADLVGRTASIFTMMESVSIFGRWPPDRFNLAYGFHFSEVALRNCARAHLLDKVHGCAESGCAADLVPWAGNAE